MCQVGGHVGVGDVCVLPWHQTATLLTWEVIFSIDKHPLSVTAQPSQGHRCSRRFQVTLVEGRGALWISRQFITGLTYREKQPFTLTFTPTDNLEQSNIPACLWIVGGSQSTWRKTSPREHVNSTQPSTLLLCSNSAKHCAAILQHCMCSSWNNSSGIKESFESSFSKIRSHGANQKACDFDSL